MSQEAVSKRVAGSLAGAIAQVAAEKRLAAQHAFRPVPAGAEAPRAVYLGACRRIADVFAANGFGYAASRPRLTRNVGEWKDEIWFQSSYHNVAGVQVALETGVILENRRLKRWRQQHASPFGTSAQVLAGHIGLLRAPWRWITWNLAAPEDREAVVADVIREIREYSVPFLERMKDVRQVATTLQEMDLPTIWPYSAVEILLCYLGTEAAEKYVHAYLMRHENFAPALSAAIDQIRRDGPPSWIPSGYAPQLALAMLHYGLS